MITTTNFPNKLLDIFFGSHKIIKISLLLLDISWILNFWSLLFYSQLLNLWPWVRELVCVALILTVEARNRNWFGKCIICHKMRSLVKTNDYWREILVKRLCWQFDKRLRHKVELEKKRGCARRITTAPQAIKLHCLQIEWK